MVFSTLYGNSTTFATILQSKTQINFVRLDFVIFVMKIPLGVGKKQFIVSCVYSKGIKAKCDNCYFKLLQLTLFNKPYIKFYGTLSGFNPYTLIVSVNGGSFLTC